MEVSVHTTPHVAINAHLLSGRAWYRSAGVHRYIYQLLRHLGQADEALQYTVLLGEGILPPEVHLSTQRSRWPTSRATIRIAWEQLIQPWTLSRIKADLAHGPLLVAPMLAPCPAVVTIHDLSFIRYPQLFRPANRLYLTTMTRLSARRARRFIAVSAHTASESVKLLGIPKSRIDVVYHGVDPSFRPLPVEQVESFRRKMNLPQRYVLCVGTLEPRKNHTRLVEAFARLCLRDTKLVLAGGKGWLYDELFAKVKVLGMSDHIIFAGYVGNEDLPLWYNAATAFAYPSLYEGFGMPILEAQACGTPVMTSTASSLPEAAGDGALMVDADDVTAIAAGLERILTDEPLRGNLRERGLAHASQFTWAQTARETARVYRQTLVEEKRL
jgi:glycosyltransferase involved in cell wall biosynthesis